MRRSKADLNDKNNFDGENMNTKKHLCMLFITAALMGSSSQAMHLYQQERVVEKEEAKKATDQLMKLLRETDFKRILDNDAEINHLTKKINNLISKGADPDLKYENCMVAFSLAAATGNIKIVRFFLKNINSDLKGKPLYLAARNGHTDIAKLLLENEANPHRAYEYERKTPLMQASEKGHLGIVSLLLEKGAYINAKDYNDCTALSFAAEHNHTAIVKLLLEKGANANTQEYTLYRDTPLIKAAARGYLDIVDLLLKAGANPDTQNKDRETALTWATRRKNIKIMNLLLEKNANPNLQQHELKTALMIAAEQGDTGAVEILLKKNADPYIKSKYGKNALFFAAEQGHCDIAHLLLQSLVQLQKLTTTSIESASKEKNSYLCLLPGDLVKLATKYTITAYRINMIHAVSDYGSTPLHGATFYGHADFVRLLLEHGADKTIKNNFGKTALDIAKEKSNQAIIDLLHDKPAESQSEQN